MNKDAMVHGTGARGVVVGATLALALAACGGAVQSGAAVGKVGHGLSAHAAAVPQGAEVCALSDALAALPGTEKPVNESCGKAARSDLLWRRTMVVLSAYGETLETLSSGGNTDNAGRLEAAETGVSGNDWAAAEGPAEQAARDAATALVGQMNSGNTDLGRAIHDAAPHVKTICDGLGGYLEAQVKGFSDVQKEAEKKRASRADRRCGAVSGTTVCVSESPIDRMVYGDVFAQAALQESRHVAVRDSVAGFCAAHRKLEEANADGRLSKDKTYAEVIDAVRVAQHPQGGAAAKPAKK